MSFVGVEVKPRKVVWVDASSERHVSLSNACLVKHPKKENARVILEVLKPNSEEGPASEQKLKRVALAVLSSRSENIQLDLILTSRLGLTIAGKSAAGAVVHVVGSEYFAEYEESEEEDMDLDGGIMGVDVEFGGSDSEGSSISDDDGDSPSADDAEDSGNGEDADKKVVARKRSGGLPVVNHRSGLKFQDIIIGSGKKVVQGKNVALKYTLRLENGKVVDKAEARKPFKFRLGVGECVKGFDIGVSGMREGGERHLIVPPDLAYGRNPPPGIPRNATLYFDVTVIKAF